MATPSPPPPSSGGLWALAPSVSRLDSIPSLCRAVDDQAAALAADAAHDCAPPTEPRAEADRERAQQQQLEESEGGGKGVSRLEATPLAGATPASLAASCTPSEAQATATKLELEPLEVGGAGVPSDSISQTSSVVSIEA